MNNSNWLLTYGDLLTLLVCLFVTLSSFGSFNTSNNRPLHTLKSSNNNNLVTAQPSTAAGTAIANYLGSQALAGTYLSEQEQQLTLNQQDLIFAMTRADFTSSGINQRAEYSLSTWVSKLQELKLERLFIESCERFDKNYNRSLWRAALVIAKLKEHYSGQILSLMKNDQCSSDEQLVKVFVK